MRILRVTIETFRGDWYTSYLDSRLVAKITIKDIARMAGVSISTVSLILSGKGYVSDATRNKVEQIIAKYNYHPHKSARRLPSKMTGNIGFIILDWST